MLTRDRRAQIAAAFSHADQASSAAAYRSRLRAVDRSLQRVCCNIRINCRRLRERLVVERAADGRRERAHCATAAAAVDNNGKRAATTRCATRTTDSAA